MKINIGDFRSDSLFLIKNVSIFIIIATYFIIESWSSYRGGGRFPAVFPVSWLINCLVNSSALPAVPALFLSNRFPHFSDPGPEEKNLNG